MDYRGVIERFLVEHFPLATIAVVGGSTARGTRTPTSDIDLLVIGTDLFDDGRHSLAGGFAFGGEVFEVFAYAPSGFAAWAERGVADHRPVIVDMLLEGVEIRGGEALHELRAAWRPVIEAGPSVESHELTLRRYAATDLLDDLKDSTDPLERQVIAGLLFQRVGELMLLTERRWIGTGKYLPRRLRDMDPLRTEALSAPLVNGDLIDFTDRVELELENVGGRVRAGFVR